MGQTLTNLTIHIIFSTKDRMPLIEPKYKEELMAYLAGLVQKLKANSLIINGTQDHVHMLVEIPSSISVSELMKFVKGNSSRWVNQSRDTKEIFAWQDGYAAFSVSKSAIPRVFHYIKNQENHHKKRSFQDEVINFLEKHSISYNDQYIWK